MSIVSGQFAAFAALAVAAHHLLPVRFRAPMLLVWSYAFCAFLGWEAVAILAAVTAANFVIGAQTARAPGDRKGWLWLGIALNVGVVLAARLVGGKGPAIIAGLSFYALQAISYLVDLHRGTLRTTPGLVPLALYLGYFPKLLAGPIERPRQFFERLSTPRIVDDEVIGRAGTLIVTGMARKLLIADPLGALIPASAFASPLSLAPASAAFALVAYAFVIYNDFAGYTSIVRGVSLLFGIELSPNFTRPFAAATFADFWTRWHITLSNWLRDYIYMPLSRTLLRRNPRIRNVPNVIVPPLVTMLASGLWHGGSLNMMIWGGLHGCYLIGERVAGLLRGRPIAARAHGWRRPVRIALVFTVITAALAFFRMDADVALRFFMKAFDGAGTEHIGYRAALLLTPALWLDWMQAHHGDEATFDHWHKFGRAALTGCALLLCFLMSHTTANAPFIYQAF